MQLSDLKIGDVLIHDDGELHIFVPFNGENSKFLSRDDNCWHGYGLNQRLLQALFTHIGQNKLLNILLGENNGEE